MYRVAILGCENSHADFFLDYILKNRKVDDVEVVGIYSDEEEPMKRLSEQFGVYTAKSYDEFVGKIDGLIITARHGDNHYKYAKPYIESGIPMFIDKPITVSEEDAIEFIQELKANKVRVSGGSMCKYAAQVQELKKLVESGEQGKVLGGFFRAPINILERYGGFYFYTQHLVQVMCEIFGFYPESVKAFTNDDVITCVFRYKDFDVTGEYVKGNPLYCAAVSFENSFEGGSYKLDLCSEKEFQAFYHILKGGEQELGYSEFVAPVFILNAIDRSMESGKEEAICYPVFE